MLMNRLTIFLGFYKYHFAAAWLVLMGFAIATDSGFAFFIAFAFLFAFPWRAKGFEEIMASRLSCLLAAGYSIPEALSLLGNYFPFLRRNLKKAADLLQNGQGFSETARSLPRVFPKQLRRVAEAGEKAGNLPGTLRVYADYLHKEEMERFARINMLGYPIIILFVYVLCLLFFSIFIFPQFSSMFESFNGSLPLITKITEEISGFIRVIAVPILSVLFVSDLVKRIVTQRGLFERYRETLDAYLFASFTRKLLDLGTPFGEAAAASAEISGIRKYKKAASKLRDSLQNGADLMDELKNGAKLPQDFIVAVAAGTLRQDIPGALEHLEESIRHFYESRLGVMYQRKEAIIILALSVIVGIFILGSYIPIFQLPTMIG